MRIAIIDDITSERKLLRERLHGLLSRHLLHADIFEYENGDSFLAAAEKEHFTLVFLDIYMKGKNGVETARKLREFDTECLLVFVTSSTDHALDGFRVRAIQYLVKPYTEHDLDALLVEITKRLPDTASYIDLHIVGDQIRLRLSEILYAEHYQHQVHISTTDGRTISVRQTFREFSAGLNDDRFIPCNQGTIVNLEHVVDFDGTAFLLTNQKKIPVSRNLVTAARQSFADFLFQRR